MSSRADTILPNPLFIRSDRPHSVRNTRTVTSLEDIYQTDSTASTQAQQPRYRLWYLDVNASEIASIIDKIWEKKFFAEKDHLRTAFWSTEQSDEVVISKMPHDTLLETLEEISDLENRAIITSDEAKQTLKRSIFDAISFIGMLPNTIKPFVSASEDGETVLHWLHNNSETVVEFNGDRHFGYALLKDGKFVPGVSEGNLDHDLPSDLVVEISPDDKRN